MNFSAVILAGGKSTRTGRAQAGLAVGGQTLLARQIALARELGAAEVFISGRAQADYSAFNCPVLHDERPEAGPLAGIARALEAMQSPLLLVLAVDLPELNVEQLRRLAAGAAESFGAILRLAGRIEPLAAFYPRTALPLLEKLFANPERRSPDRPAKPKHADREIGAPGAKQFAERCVQSKLADWVDLGETDTRYFAHGESPADRP